VRSYRASPLPIAWPAAASLPPDLAATKQAIELVRQGKPSEATLIATSIGDPVAQKLVEWTLLRHPESEVRFERYTAFTRANTNWPSTPLLRRRAEAKLWQDRRDAATVRRFFGEEQPTSPLGAPLSWSPARRGLAVVTRGVGGGTTDGNG
jgi:soluble lytic murein transglycosylase